jgi:hypothetical protein
VAEPTLQQVFGANASQTSTTLTISKADLAAAGLTASASNTAESLFVAIMLLADNYLNETQQSTNADIQVTIADSGFPQLVNRNSQIYRQVTFNVNLQAPDSGFNLDPDNY